MIRLLILFACMQTAALNAQELLNEKVPIDSKVEVSADQALQALTAIETGKWKPLVNDEKSRGPAASVYAKISPSTVVVRAGQGHGTGFIVHEDGWVITNYHVVENSTIHPASGALFAQVYVGSLEKNLMQLNDKPIPALVFAASKDKDLALLKLFAPEEKKWPVVTMAKEIPGPGADCFAIGHPASGMLWTLRTGVVSAIGTWPKDGISTTMRRLFMSSTDREEFSKSLSTAPTRKVLISTCGINPGDSGGPLLNEKGELIAVTFGIPKNLSNQGISLDKVSYHVHMDELSSFLKQEYPKTPLIHIPNPWPKALYSALRDYNKDERPDTWIFGMKKDEPLTGMFIDVDQDSPEKFFFADKKDPKLWDFEFVVQATPCSRMFYDSDNDGEIDRIHSDFNNDKIADNIIQLTEEGWIVVDKKDQKMADSSIFKDPDLQKAFVKVWGSE